MTIIYLNCIANRRDIFWKVDIITLSSAIDGTIPAWSKP